MSEMQQSLSHLRTAIAETSSEDSALAREVSELINKLQINPPTLAKDVKESLDKVSAVLRSEGLSDADETALVISVDRKKLGDKKQQRIKRRLKSKYQELLQRHLAVEKKLNYLKENVGLIRNSIAENEAEYKNEYSSYKLMTNKLVEYQGIAGTMETDIDNLNLKELEPAKILDKYERLMEKKGRLADINQALAPYNELPPNLLQAKALVENKELEYKKLCQYF